MPSLYLVSIIYGASYMQPPAFEVFTLCNSFDHAMKWFSKHLQLATLAKMRETGRQLWMCSFHDNESGYGWVNVSSMVHLHIEDETGRFAKTTIKPIPIGPQGGERVKFQVYASSLVDKFDENDYLQPKADILPRLTTEIQSQAQWNRGIAGIIAKYAAPRVTFDLDYDRLSEYQMATLGTVSDSKSCVWNLPDTVDFEQCHSKHIQTTLLKDPVAWRVMKNDGDQSSQSQPRSRYCMVTIGKEYEKM